MPAASRILCDMIVATVPATNVALYNNAFIGFCYWETVAPKRFLFCISWGIAYSLILLIM